MMGSVFFSILSFKKKSNLKALVSQFSHREYRATVQTWVCSGLILVSDNSQKSNQKFRLTILMTFLIL